MRYLINENGSPFEPTELSSIREHLNALNDSERKDYRNGNAQHLAQHLIEKLLIVSGPGTGKSTLFKQRILHWLRKTPGSKILAVSFVRKLVADLAADIAKDDHLSDAQKAQVEVLTLHGYARSIVEKNHGTKKAPLQPHFKIIGESWKSVIWGDVLAFVSQADPGTYSWKAFEKQLHEANLEKSSEWKAMHEGYSTLCTFYNAVGFCDLIIRAQRALDENAALEEHDYFIIDEYQDFNQSEDQLIKQAVLDSSGVLLVGDDDQVLYEKLRAGKAELIRSVYTDDSYGNGMLPYCGRCGQHIVQAAAHFISQNADAECIEKVYLALEKESEATKVKIVACPAPQSAVDYIKKFVEEHESEILERKEQIEDGEEKDAYLLILTPAKGAAFYNDSANELTDLVKKYKNEEATLSEDYYKLLSYFSLANKPNDNFTFRKVLHHEGLDQKQLVGLVKTAIEVHVPLCSLEDPIVTAALEKVRIVAEILGRDIESSEKIALLEKHISITDRGRLVEELEVHPIGQDEETRAATKEEEDAELTELGVQKMSAVDMMTIVGSKGLSAEHVIIVGFDNVNMNYVTRNAFYVAMTRARKSLHLITALGCRGSQRPSEYLNNLPDDHIEFSRYKKSNGELNSIPNRTRFIGYLRYMNELQGRGR